MKGKDKCKILKEIRAEIAHANDIEWVTENCYHKGECRGTCPKCEAEVRKLEHALEARRAIGKGIAVAGLSAGLIMSTTSCGLDKNTDCTECNVVGTGEETFTEELMGEVPDTTNENSESIFELMGDIVAYSADRFEKSEPIKYRATENIYLIGFIDTEYDDDTDFVIEAGESFEVVGVSDEYDMFMISCGGQLFACDRTDFELICEEIS